MRPRYPRGVSRAMVVVAAGSGQRFAGDKMLATVNGRALVDLTVSRVRQLVDEVVLVCRPDQRAELAHLGVRMADGGATRTESEASGLAALSAGHDLVGIHDGARPNLFPGLVERLYSAAAQGGAVPVLVSAFPIAHRLTGRIIEGAVAVQTPQVFRGEELISAYRDRGGADGHDTVEIVQRASAVRIVAVPGDPRNIKVTFPADLAGVIL